jgi:chromosome segregation ATPase
MTQAEIDARIAELESRKSDLYGDRATLQRDIENILTSMNSAGSQIDTSRATLKEYESRLKDLKSEHSKAGRQVDSIDRSISSANSEIQMN